MANVTCNKGHVYDSSLGYCPACRQESGYDDVPATTPVAPEFNNGFANSGTPGVTVPVDSGFGDGSFLDNGGGLDSYDGTQVVSLMNDASGFDPVVGWLICTKGPNRGKDYRLHSGTNFIGRSPEMDVCIDHDQTISSKKAALLTYDDRSGSFFIQQGEVRNLIYLNGKPVLSYCEIQKYDKVEIGSTELVFLPLCGDGFSWQDN